MVTTLNDAPAVALSEFDRGYYGWRVALAACLGVMVGFGSLFVYTFSVFMKPLSAEFGWGREAISRGFGFAALSMAFCSPLLGQWLDRYGAAPSHPSLHDHLTVVPSPRWACCARTCGSSMPPAFCWDSWAMAPHTWPIRAPSPRGFSGAWEWPWRW